MRQLSRGPHGRHPQVAPGSVSVNTSPPRLPLGRGAAGPRPCPPPGRQHVLGRGAHGPLFLPGPLLPAAAPVHSRLGPRAAGHSRGRLPSWEKCRPLGPAPRARPRAACAPHAQAPGALRCGPHSVTAAAAPFTSRRAAPGPGGGHRPVPLGVAVPASAEPRQHRPHTPERRAGGLGRGGGLHAATPHASLEWAALGPLTCHSAYPAAWAPGESPRPAGGSEAPLSPWQSPRFASCRPGPPGEGGRAPVPLQRRAWAGEARPLQQRRRHRGPAAGVLAV